MLCERSKEVLKQLIDGTGQGEDYVLVYDFFSDNRIKKIAKEYAKERRLSIYAVCPYWQRYADKNFVTSGPETFVSLVKNASFVVTNSFHAIAVYESIFDGICELKDKWNLEDVRLESYAYKRFYQGIDNSILFNTFHKDTPSGCKWRRQEVLGILSRPKVEKCLDYVANNNGFTLEGKLFFEAYRHKCFPVICFFRAVSRGLRRIKRRFN